MHTRLSVLAAKQSFEEQTQKLKSNKHAYQKSINLEFKKDQNKFELVNSKSTEESVPNMKTKGHKMQN